jgi:hypothetical protein
MTMITSVQKLDALLRGEMTTLPKLRGGTLDVPVVGLSLLLSVLGMVYGACMGLFAITGHGSGAGMKVPALFVLTLIVTCPSLYVFNALFGSRLALGSMMRLMVGSTAVALAVLSSIGPITAFFGVSSTSYAFMVLLNVVVFAIAGLLGLGFLLQTLNRMTVATSMPALPVEAPVPSAAADPDAGPSEEWPAEVPPSAIARHSGEPIRGSVWLIFRTWVLVFGLVGMQMAWLLRPFIGSPDKPFTWFRPRGGNFFEAVYVQALKMFG